MHSWLGLAVVGGLVAHSWNWVLLVMKSPLTSAQRAHGKPREMPAPGLKQSKGVSGRGFPPTHRSSGPPLPAWLLSPPRARPPSPLQRASPATCLPVLLPSHHGVQGAWKLLWEPRGEPGGELGTEAITWRYQALPPRFQPARSHRATPSRLITRP